MPPMLSALFLAVLSLGDSDGNDDFRPPCVPLDVASPYQSTWSCNDQLSDAAPQHWTGELLDWVGLLKVGDTTYRWMGKPLLDLPAAQQLERHVSATASTYTFQASGISLNVEFRTPAFEHDEHLDLATRPVTFVSFNVDYVENSAESVEVYFDMSGATSTAKDTQEVSWARSRAEGVEIMRVGTTAQKVAESGGDRSDWGYRYVAVPSNGTGFTVKSVMAADGVSRASFVNGSYFLLQDDTGPPRAAAERPIVLSAGFKLDKKESCAFNLQLMFDEVVAQRYFGSDLAPLWTRSFSSAEEMLSHTQANWAQLIVAATLFDGKLTKELTERGGDKYAALGSLIYRQTFGATTTAWNPKTGEAWPFMKEISSDGDVSTVDVIYPAFPLFMHLAPEFFRKLMVPLMVYSINGTAQYGLDIKYNLPWAPHHLGHWPVCDLLPNHQEQMPVEESGNMLIMLAGVAQQQRNNAPTKWLEDYWGVLKTWADFLASTLPDPGNQLCTDDFEGPNPHNVNLAAKGIVALGAYAKLLEMDGQSAEASKYQKLAEGFVQQWLKMASDGDHYRRQFDLNGTWSQKYNLVWQKALGLQLFPSDVFAQEEVNYESHRNSFGVPLDDRHIYTKADWSMWSAAMGSQAQFEATVDSLYKFATSTPDRVPFTDWFDTKTGKLQGFRARPVMGGLFIGLLTQSPSHHIFV